MPQSGESLPKAASWNASSCSMNHKAHRQASRPVVRISSLRQSCCYGHPRTDVIGFMKRRFQSFRPVQSAVLPPSKSIVNVSFAADLQENSLRGNDSKSSGKSFGLSLLSGNETSESGWTAYFNSSSSTRTSSHRNALLDNAFVKHARECLIAGTTVSKLKVGVQTPRPYCDDSSIASDASSGPARALLDTRILDRQTWNVSISAKSHVLDGRNLSYKRTAQANEQHSPDSNTAKHIRLQSSNLQMPEKTRLP